MSRQVASAAVLLLAFGASVARGDGELIDAGRTVTRLVLRSDLDSRNVERMRNFLSIQEGDELTSDSIRDILLNLQGTGLVAQAEVFTRGDGEGVEVVIAAWSRVLVESLTFEGEFALTVDEMTRVAPLKAQRPLMESRVLRSVYDLQDLHERNGYLEARVRARVDVDHAARKASVVFEVDSGPRARIGAVTFGGDLGPVDPAELRGAMESEQGGRYWPQRIERDRDNLQRYLIKAGYRTATVGAPEESYDWDAHAMSVHYSVEVGPQVEVIVVGGDRGALRDAGLLGFLGTQGYDPALVDYSVRRVRRWYQSQGYYDVEVDTAEETRPDRIQLTMTIETGTRYTLSRLRLEGNEAVDDDTLKRLMATSERRALTPGSGRLVDEVLEEDLSRMRSYYALEGFGQAQVGPGEVSRNGDRLELTIPVDEGPRRMVGEVSWDGFESVPLRDLQEGLAIQAGGPFHETLLEQAENELRSRYRDDGYDRALVSSTLDWSADSGEVHVTFHVLEGRRTVLRRLIIRGQQVTSPWVLRGVIDLEPGDPVSQSKLLAIQRRLYQLGIFTSVDVSLAQGQLLTGERDVVVTLEEGDRRRVSLGGGYDTEDGLRALLGYSLGNLFGRGVSLDFDAVVAQRQELYRLLLLKPGVGRLPFPTRFTIFRTREEELNFSQALEGDFLVEQVGLQLGADLARKRVLFPLLYTYKRVDNNVPAGGEFEEVFPREKSKVRISSITAGLRADRRDSPVLASKGRNSVVSVEYAFPVFNTDEDFVKLFVQQTQYLDLGGLGIVGASLRLGGIESLRDGDNGNTDTPGGCSSDVTPDFGVALSERFFAGGRSTHRAYELDGLGILGETLFIARDEVDGACVDVGAFASGGNGLALFNFDYRYSFLPGFWATAFFDSGNVWQDWRDISVSEVKNGVGFGFGWDSPVGPLRLEIGWKLDREEFEDPYEIFLSFGTAF